MKAVWITLVVSALLNTPRVAANAPMGNLGSCLRTGNALSCTPAYGQYLERGKVYPPEANDGVIGSVYEHLQVMEAGAIRLRKVVLRQHSSFSSRAGARSWTSNDEQTFDVRTRMVAVQRPATTEPLPTPAILQRYTQLRVVGGHLVEYMPMFGKSVRWNAVYTTDPSGRDPGDPDASAQVLPGAYLELVPEGLAIRRAPDAQDLVLSFP
jgi:hypothetical protein